jgi:hypothetical protein
LPVTKGELRPLPKPVFYVVITQSIITFYNFYLSNPSFSNLVLSLFVSTTIRDVLSGLADLRATLGAPPPTGSLPRRRSQAFTVGLRTPVRPVREGARRVQRFDVPRDLALVCVDQKSVNKNMEIKYHLCSLHMLSSCLHEFITKTNESNHRDMIFAVLKYLKVA